MYLLRMMLKRKRKWQSKKLGKLLKEARGAMTQTQAAARLGVSQPYIARLESGSQAATFIEVEELARLYGRRLAELETLQGVEKDHPAVVPFPETIAKAFEELRGKQKRRRKKARPRKSAARTRRKS